MTLEAVKVGSPAQIRTEVTGSKGQYSRSTLFQVCKTCLTDMRSGRIALEPYTTGLIHFSRIFDSVPFIAIFECKHHQV